MGFVNALTSSLPEVLQTSANKTQFASTLNWFDGILSPVKLRCSGSVGVPSSFVSGKVGVTLHAGPSGTGIVQSSVAGNSARLLLQGMGKTLYFDAKLILYFDPPQGILGDVSSPIGRAKFAAAQESSSFAFGETNPSANNVGFGGWDPNAAGSYGGGKLSTPSDFPLPFNVGVSLNPYNNVAVPTCTISLSRFEMEF